MHLLTIIKKINILIPVFSICMLISVETSAKTVIDHVGRRVSVPDNPQKIIALAPSITEVIYDLGEEHRLRGVTQYSDFPAQAKTLPRVGSYVRLDLEKIVIMY